MKDKIKDTNIYLPANFVLTENGLKYCTDNSIPIRDVPIGDRRKEGFSWEAYKAPLLQKLIKSRIISAIDISRPEFLSKRKEVIDLTKLLLYGLFYARLAPSLKMIFGNSEVISEIQKTNPSLKIGADTKFNRDTIAQFSRENDELIESFKKSIVEPSFYLIDNDKELKEKDKHEKKLIIRTFIDQINNEIWFLYKFVSKAGGGENILKVICDLLISSMKKTKIADYCALMVMELLQKSEMTHFERMASSMRMGSPEDISGRLIRDKDFRRELAEYAGQSKIFINMNFEFEGDILQLSDHLRFQITITSKGNIPEIQRRYVRDKNKYPGSEYSISVIQDDVPSDEKFVINYLSSLNDVCLAENIGFEEKVVFDVNRDQTLIKLIFNI